MKLADVSPEYIARVATYCWHRIIEKHEGPWEWHFLFNAALVEILHLEGFDVLLPVEKDHHSNITFTRCIVSADAQTLTIFLQDTTYDTGLVAGYMAVCEKVPCQEWYITIRYHECWVDNLRAKTRLVKNNPSSRQEK